MKYILDLNNPQVRLSMEELGLEPHQLLVKNLLDFKGQGKIKELRYTHYQEKLEKNKELIKDHISNYLKSKNYPEIPTNKSENNNSQDAEKVKALHRHYLSLHIEEETKKRAKISKTLEKLNRKQTLDTKIKQETLSKNQKKNYHQESSEKNLKAILPTKNKNFRTRTVSPKVPENKDFLSSRLSIKLNKSIDDDIESKLESLHEKFDRSRLKHDQALKDKTEKISWHTQKVYQLLNNYNNVRDQSILLKTQQLITKFQDVESRREKNKTQIYEKLKKNQEKFIEKHSKIKENQQEEIKKEQKRIDIIEKKMNSTILNIKAKYQEAKDERDLKYEKAKLKEEDTLENAARLKKAELKKKLKILEKHYELDKRLETLKEEKDRANEKKRDDAHKNVMEKVKLKKLKIMVEKTKDPIKMHKILDEFYRQPLEQLKPIELPSKDIV